MNVIRPSNDKGSGLVDRSGALAASGTLGHHQRTDRLHRAVPAFGGAPGPTRQRSSGCAHRIEGIRFAGPAAVLSVTAIDLHHRDPSSSEVTGQARAITTGPFDTNQDYSPEAAQPLEQPAVSARRGWELLDAEQTSN